jgi:predicted permease
METNTRLVHVHQSEGRRVIWISGYIFVDWSGKKTTTRFGFMVFNATFNNISAISMVVGFITTYAINAYHH